MCVPLHNHSDYSNLDGLALPVEIAHRCAEIGVEACGLTDHGVVTGHIDFYKEMTKVGVKPILGVEAYHGTKWTDFKGQERDQSHLILLAQNDRGLRNLWTMVNEAAQPKYFRWVPRVSWEMLEKYNEGIIATSACALGMVPRGVMSDNLDPLNRYLDIFGDRFYIELSTYDHDEDFNDFDRDSDPLTTRDINEALVAVAQERGIPLVYGNDAHYARPDQYELHNAYLAAGVKDKKLNQTIYTPRSERKMWHPNCLYIMDEADVRNRLNYLPGSVVDECIDNSEYIAAKTDAKLPNIERHLPVFVPKDCPWIDDNPSAEELFVRLIEKGIEKKYPVNVPQEVWDRVFREAEIFLEAGLHHYFLLAWDVCEFCDRNGIERGPGRGSSAGCMVAYALGITDAEPLSYNLIFERFWNPGRAKGFPDIDSDFAREHRQTVINYLKDRWGANRVKPIGNTGRMKPKSAVDKFYKACDIDWASADELKKILEEVPDIEIHGPESIAWSRAGDPDYVLTGAERTIYVEDHVGDEIKKWIGRDDKRAKFVWLLEHLTNRIGGYGIHASGVVVSDVDLNDLLPGDLRGPKEERVHVTQWPMDTVDELMFIKFDVLGLKTLDTLADWQDQMLQQQIELEWSRLDLEEHPEEMWEMLHRGFTAGIFQIEGGYAKRLCEDFKPTSIEDLAIIGALNRPGPIRSGAPDRFIARRNNLEPVTFDHPILSDILDVTYGLFLYQEQVIAFFNKMGYDLSDSDAVRKILGKKKPEEMKALADGKGEWKGKGYYEIAKSNGIDDKAAKIIWEKIVNFASYSFNKSHAVAYAIIGFRCLFAKYYAPAHFYKACIATVEQQKKAELVPQYIGEARRLGIHTYPPDITRSHNDVEVVDGHIYLGFGNVKGVATGGEVIVELRDQGEDISTPEKVAAILEEDSKRLTKLKAQYKKEGKAWDGPQKSLKQRLNAKKLVALWDAGAWDNLGERRVALTEKQKHEKELLNCIITDNSHQILMNNEEAISSCDYYQDILDSVYDGTEQQWNVPGIVTHIKNVKSKREGKPMGVITIEYEGDTIEFAVAPHLWKAYKFLFKERSVGIFTINRNSHGLGFSEGYKLK